MDVMRISTGLGMKEPALNVKKKGFIPINFKLQDSQY
jgi:hypothetical protein